MKLKNLLSFGVLAVTAVTFVGCDKTKPYDTTIPEEVVHFTKPKTQLVALDATVDPNPVYNLGVGWSNVSSVERSVEYHITSPSGAVPGVDYSIPTGNTTGTLTFPANEVIANIVVNPNAAAYGLGDRDTLVVYLANPSHGEVAKFYDTVYLILRGPTACDEGSPNLTALNGDYTNTNEYADGSFNWGPYTTTVSAAQVTGPTTGRVSIANLYDTGWGDIVFELDWSDPTNLTAMPVAGVVPNSDAGDLSSTYAGTAVIVRPHSNGDVGTYSYCDEEFDLTMQFGVNGVGYFGNVFREVLQR